MRTLIFLFVVLPALVALAVGSLLVLAVEPQPLVTEARRLDSQAADDAWRWIKGAVGIAVKARNDVTIVADEGEFNGLLALAARGLPGLDARAEVNPGGATGTATLSLPGNPLGSFLNLRFGLLASKEGLSLAPVALGPLELPGPAVLALLRVGLDVALGDGGGTEILGAVQGVAVDGKQLTLRLAPDPRVTARLRGWETRLAGALDTVRLLGDPATVRVYYQALIPAARGGGRRSLADAMQELFTLARNRSAANDPVAENRAALLALAGYFGNNGLLKLVGPVITDEMRARLPRRRDALLGRREDLAKHFIISAGLQIIATSGLSRAIGEFKEFLDTRKKGSGFSFVDLAADRAGVRFAEAALASGNARRLQDLVAGGAGEAAFFPPLDGLVEWMDQATFERKFGGIDDDRYRTQVGEIDGRIARLPAYAG